MNLIGIIRRKSARVLLLCLKVAVGLCAIILLAIGGLQIRLAFPVLQIDPKCHYSRVTFSGPKSERFVSTMVNEVEWREEPYSIRDNQIFTTGRGLPYDHMTSAILNTIAPGWSFSEPRPISPEAARLINTWKKREESGADASNEWCHVVEAAVAKDGIDIEARRNHPEIWPPDVWNVPPEPEQAWYHVLPPSIHHLVDGLMRSTPPIDAKARKDARHTGGTNETE